jgi:choline dehydrogenase-like flavoprotein
MTPDVTVVGSGASGVHFALSLLNKGRRVRLIDVGRQARTQLLPDATLNDLKQRLPDPAGYFLGENFDAVFLPGAREEYYGIPPSKEHVLRSVPRFRASVSGFAPLFSFARGGLGEVWTAGCYPLSAAETEDFPFPHAELARGYDEVARRIGVTGVDDDLARFMPLHDHLLPPLRLDEHSERLLSSYGRVRARLNREGAYFGRTRVATLSQPLNGRSACDYKGRCLWGCPGESLYTPSLTLRECQASPNFDYVPGVEVTHLRLGAGGRIQSLAARDVETGREVDIPAESVALAAGALMSSKIFLATMLHASGGPIRLSGLMDNRQVLLPFLNLGMIGSSFAANTYQYHLLGIGLESASAIDYVHGQVTTLKTALVHPLIQRLPLPMRAATRAFRSIHGALGLVNVNLRDTRRDSCFVELVEGDRNALRVHYEPDADEPSRLKTAVQRMKRVLRALGCVVPPGMAHLRPMGSSVHYAGLLPMTRSAAPLTTNEFGESRDIRGLFIVDGAAFPVLPAKNITFTLMANAVRIANAAW